MRVAIVGRGRLGRTFASLLRDRGLDVTLVGRGEAPHGDVVLLAVPDGAIVDAARNVPHGPVVLHCSGACDVDVLRPHRPAGSMHPLMTFPGPEIAIPPLERVPCAIAGDAEARDAARDLASRLGMSSFEVPGDRALYHAAAVAAGNFAATLLLDAAEMLATSGAPRERAAELLLPLALQSLRNAASDGAISLTGPASRGDVETIARHRAALSDNGLETLLPIYDAMSARVAHHTRADERSSREDERS